MPRKIKSKAKPQKQKEYTGKVLKDRRYRETKKNQYKLKQQEKAKEKEYE